MVRPIGDIHAIFRLCCPVLCADIPRSYHRSARDERPTSDRYSHRKNTGFWLLLKTDIDFLRYQTSNSLLTRYYSDTNGC